MVKRLISYLLIVMISSHCALQAKDFSASFKDAGSQAVLNTLTRETGYEFIYQKDILQNIKKKVNGTYTSATAEGLLDKVVRGCLGLSWQIMDGSVILSEPDTVDPQSKTPAAQQGIIEGVVLDEMGETLPGATVF